MRSGDLNRGEIGPLLGTATQRPQPSSPTGREHGAQHSREVRLSLLCPGETVQQHGVSGTAQPTM